MMCNRTTASGTQQRNRSIVFHHIFRLFVGDGLICYLCWSQRCNKSLRCSNPSTQNNTRLWLFNTPIYNTSYNVKLYTRVFLAWLCAHTMAYKIQYLTTTSFICCKISNLPFFLIQTYFPVVVTKHVESDETDELKEAALGGSWPCLRWSRRSTADGRCCSGPTSSWSAAHGSTKHTRERETADSVCGRGNRRAAALSKVFIGLCTFTSEQL